MNQTQRIKEDTIQLYYENYKENSLNFDLLYSLTYKELLIFLRKKGCLYEDAEDMLQEYFINDFSKALSKYDIENNVSFISYIRKLVYFRFINFRQNQRKHRDMIELLKLNYSLYVERHGIYKQYTGTESIKPKMLEVLDSMSNENHRKAYILRLCLPAKMSMYDICSILKLKYSCFTTWLFRSRKQVHDQLSGYCDEIGVDFDDIDPADFLQLKKHHLICIDNHLMKMTLYLFLFYTTDIAKIANYLGEGAHLIHDYIRRGLWEMPEILLDQLT